MKWSLLNVTALVKVNGHHKVIIVPQGQLPKAFIDLVGEKLVLDEEDYEHG